MTTLTPYMADMFIESHAPIGSGVLDAFVT